MVNYLKDTHLVAKDPLKFNYAINTCLLNLIIISFHVVSLNFYEHLKTSSTLLLL